jgi:putative transposase
VEKLGNNMRLQTASNQSMDSCPTDFVALHAAVHNLFNLGRHLISAVHYRDLRTGAFDDWAAAVA